LGAHGIRSTSIIGHLNAAAVDARKKKRKKGELGQLAALHSSAGSAHSRMLSSPFTYPSREVVEEKEKKEKKKKKVKKKKKKRRKSLHVRH